MQQQYQYPTEMLFDVHHKSNPQSHVIKKGARQQYNNDNNDACAICGRNDFKVGYLTHFNHKNVSVLSESYGEHSSLAHPENKLTCPFCESAIRDEFVSLNGIIMNTEFAKLIVGVENSKVGTNDSYITAKDIAGYLADPPAPPFVMAFNKNAMGKNGTHFLHKAVINYSQDNYIITMYDEQIHVSRDFVKRYLDFIEKHPGKYNRFTPQNLYKSVLAGNMESKMVKSFPALAADMEFLTECCTSNNLKIIYLLHRGQGESKKTKKE